MTLREARQFIADYYNNPNPGEDDGFLFEEASRFLIENYHDPRDMHDLAFFYLEHKRHDLEFKYLEMAASYDYPPAFEELGYIWYYGQNGEVDYEKAYGCFSKGASLEDDLVKVFCEVKLADMYHNGYFVKRDEVKYRAMVEELYKVCMNPGQLYSVYSNPAECLPYADVFLRLAGIRSEEGKTDEALDLLSRVRVRLADEIKWNPLWWGNIELMEETVTLQYELGGRPSVLDIYDLFSLALEKCRLCFSYEGKPYFVEVVAEEDGTSLFFEGKWFRSPRDFFSKAQINGLKITYVYDKLYGFLVQ